MQCPVDGETLVIAERSGVEIDYCPKCRGVWLDRGELDKIIERAGLPSPRGTFSLTRMASGLTRKSANPSLEICSISEVGLNYSRGAKVETLDV